MTKIRGRSRMALGALACVSFALPLPASAVATPVEGAAAVAGQWDMTLGDSDRTCRITFEAQNEAGGVLDMPAECKLSLPILAKVGAWHIPQAGRIDLADASGKAVLDFAGGTGHSFKASGPEGETYRLVEVNQAGDAAGQFAPENVSQAPGFEVSQAAPAAAASPKPAPKRKPQHALKPADVAGRYELWREGGKDTQCMIELDDQARASGGSKVTLAPACKDQGILIFDPVGWRLAAGRLVLTARRGFVTHYDSQGDGSWLKDPKEGKPLILKKM